MAKLMLGIREVTPVINVGSQPSSTTDWGEGLQGDVSTDATFICAPYKCTGNQAVTSFSAPSATDVALSHAFTGCSNLEEVVLGNIQEIGPNSMEYCFQNCFSLTTAPTFSSLTSVGNNGLQCCFYGCTSLTTAPAFASVTSSGQNGFSQCFYGCTSLTTAPTFANLTTIGNSGLKNCFCGCTSLTTPPTFANLTSNTGNYGMQSCFRDCISLTSISFPSLTSIGNYGLDSCFYGCTSITSISFPALTTTSFGSYTNQFQSILSNTGTSRTHTIHFPSNLQTKISTLSGYPNFGGTNGYVTLAFDLPATS